MKSRSGLARTVHYFDSVGEVSSPSDLLGEVYDPSGTKVLDLTMTPTTSAPNVFVSNSFTLYGIGQYRVVFSVSSVVKKVELLEVGAYPIGDFSFGVSSEVLLASSIVGGVSETVTAVVLKHDGTDLNTPSSTDATYDATLASYKFSQIFSAEGSYTVVWRKDVAGQPTPVAAQDVFITKRAGFELVTFIVATLEGNNGTPHVNATLYVSKSDGSSVARGVVDNEGVATMEIEPGDYIATLDKAGSFYNNNNVSFSVLDTVVPDPSVEQVNNVLHFISKVFTPTTTAPPAPADTCLITADVFRMDGKPLCNAEIVVSLLHKPELFSGSVVFDTRKVFQTDHNGHVEFSLVRGLEVEIAVAHLSLRRTITVPSEAGPVNLFTLMSSGNDPFDVITPSIPAAPRRTL